MRWRRLVLLSAVALLPACTHVNPLVPTDVDLKEAERLERRGLAAEALIEYARAAEGIGTREDDRACLAWARILDAVLRLDGARLAASMPSEMKRELATISAYVEPGHESITMAKAMQRWTQVLSGAGESEAIQLEGARSLSRHLAAKAERPDLRRASFETGNPFLEALVRRTLVRAAADLEVYALERTPAASRSPDRAVSLMERLATAWDEFGASNPRRPGVSAHLREMAEALRARIRDLPRRIAELSCPPDVRKFVLSSVERHLQLATEAMDRAVREVSNRGDARSIVEAYETGFTHLVFARESIVEPTSAQKLALEALGVNVEGYRRFLEAEK